MTKFNKYLFKFVVFTISILTANLLGDYTSNYLTSFKNQYKPLAFALVAMAIITLIFYPLFEYLDNWVMILSKKIVRKGKSLAGQNIGLILVFLIAMIVLIYFYVKLWYGINIFKFLINPNINKLI